jgi:hypothetical protein
MMRLLRGVSFLFLIILVSCIPEDEIARRVDATLTSMSSFPKLPTYTYYPTYTIPIPSTTRTKDYKGLRSWNSIPLMDDAYNININTITCDDGTMEYQTAYWHNEVKEYYLLYMPKGDWEYINDTCEITNCQKEKIWDHKLRFIKFNNGINSRTYCTNIDIVTVSKITNVHINYSSCFID